MTIKLKKISFFLFIAFLLLPYKNIISEALPGDDAYLTVAETMPEPIGGLSQINKKISYPEAAKKAGVQGKIYVLAFVNENGIVDDVKVIKGIGAGCDEETVKAVKSSKFKPATNQGVPVKAKATLSFVFKFS